MVPLQRDNTIDDIVLKRTSEIKDLGEVFTQTLNWHQRTTCTRALLTLGLVHRLGILSANLWSLRLHYIAHF